MPSGPGTYGSKKGRPPKKNGPKNKKVSSVKGGPPKTPVRSVKKPGQKK